MSVNAAEFIMLQLNVKQAAAALNCCHRCWLQQSAATERECEFKTDYKKDIFPSFPFRKINTSLCVMFVCARNAWWIHARDHHTAPKLNMKHKPVVYVHRDSDVIIFFFAPCSISSIFLWVCAARCTVRLNERVQEKWIEITSERVQMCGRGYTRRMRHRAERTLRICYQLQFLVATNFLFYLSFSVCVFVFVFLFPISPACRYRNW